MTKIHLAFKAYDLHELLCHAIAQATGLYRDAGLEVRLLDSTFVPDDALPDNTFQAACGAALASFLRGEPRKIVFVACDKPMFWLYGRREIASPEQLHQGLVATFADAAPPAHLLRRFLCSAGITATLLPGRDDPARLALVRSGSVDAALLSSLYLPPAVEARGPRCLALLGASQRLPSTGLAVSIALYDSKPELVASMVGIYQTAMQCVYAADDTILRCVLKQAFAIPHEGLEASIQTVRECYNPTGNSDEGLLQRAMDDMAGAMGATPHPAQELYDFSYLT